MRVREELGYGKETVTRVKRELEPDHVELPSRHRRFTEDDRDRYAEEKVRRALYGEDV
jgi:hypothetical protein